MTSVHSLADLDGQPHANVFPGNEPKTIRLTLADDEEVAPHSHPGRDVVFYLIDGAIELQLGDEYRELSTGDVARFDGDQEISPRALEDTTALIVLAEQAAD